MQFDAVYVNVLHGDGSTTVEFQYHTDVPAAQLGTLCAEALTAARVKFPPVNDVKAQLDLTLVAP